MSAKLRSASILDGVRFTATVGLPNLAQGLFRRRRKLVYTADKLGLDAQTVGFMRGLRRAHAPGPLKIRVGGSEALLVLSPRDVKRVLRDSPSMFASDPEPKRKGMKHFQPNALTISRGTIWADRRAFTEAALDTDKPRHAYADRFEECAGYEVQVLTESDLDWARFSAVFQRLTRRVIFGDAATTDQELSDLLSDLMDEANGLPSTPSEKYPRLIAKIDEYIALGETGSLVSRIPLAPQSDETDTSGQVPHWFFAMQDTLALNCWRALALLVTHPEPRARALEDPEWMTACLSEAMRLYPTTPLLARESLEETVWDDGATLPAGTQVLIVNTYFHRDPDHLPHADRFAPETWVEGRAGQDWSLNHFSHGPQGCPGAHIALGIGTAALRALLAARPELTLKGGATLDPARPLPKSLDPYGLTFA